MAKGLTQKQAEFVRQYLIDLNATQAAIRAGYSSKTAEWIGPELLTKTHVTEEIQKQIKQRSARTEITQDMVVKELAKIGFADMSDFVTIDESGMVQANPLDTLEEGKSRIIRKVREKRVIKSTAEGDHVLDATYEFELCDKVKSLELLGKHLGMFTEKRDINLNQPLEVTIKKFYRGTPKESE
jgi:phage terminase small subunit